MGMSGVVPIGGTLGGFEPQLIAPSDASIQNFLIAHNANPNDVGVGIVDLESGQIYLSPASVSPSHLDLASQALGVEDYEAATNLRGFSVGREGGEWQFANNSSLNPVNNQMEAAIFASLQKTLTPTLNSH